MLTSVYLGIGSNKGSRKRNCTKAIKFIRKSLYVDAVSSFYETKPWGYTDQSSFVNCVLKARTVLYASELLVFVKSIESTMGRDNNDFRWGPRIIDIDILFYGESIIDEPELKVPHPLLHRRGFVLVPLVEIAPRVVHPVIGKTIDDILNLTPQDEDVIRKIGYACSDSDAISGNFMSD